MTTHIHISLCQHLPVFQQMSFAEFLQKAAAIFEMAVPNTSVCHVGLHQLDG